MDAVSNPVAWLEGSGGQRTLLRSSCFLGRSAACEVVVAESKVSRQHALIQARNENEFWLIDLGSANGTYLNGRRVRQPHRLSDGDAICIAGVTFAFRCRQAAAGVPADPTTEATLQEIRSQVCWLLVADIQGSTLLLRKLSAEEAPRVTGEWLEVCRQVVEDHHGTINKFLGDGFLAYWPAATAPANEVVSALLALKQLQDRANPPFRMVLHHGKVSLSSLASLGEEGLSGNEVNFAFRMEKLAGSLGIPRLVSEAAQVPLAGLLPSRSEGRHTLSGFEGEYAFFTF